MEDFTFQQLYVYHSGYIIVPAGFISIQAIPHDILHLPNLHSPESASLDTDCTRRASLTLYESSLFLHIVHFVFSLYFA